MGAARRWRQLRRRDQVRVRPAPGVDGAGRAADVPVRAGRGGAARVRATWAVDAPDEASMLAAINCAPPEPFVPPELVGQLVVLLVGCWCGDLARRARRRSRRCAHWARWSTCSARCPIPRCRACWTGVRPRTAQLFPRRVPRRPERRGHLVGARAGARGCRRRGRRSTCTRWAARSGGSATATSSFSGRRPGTPTTSIGPGPIPSEDRDAHRRRPRSLRRHRPTVDRPPLRELRRRGSTGGDRVRDAYGDRDLRPAGPAQARGTTRRTCSVATRTCGPRHEPLPDRCPGTAAGTPRPRTTSALGSSRRGHRVRMMGWHAMAHRAAAAGLGVHAPTRRCRRGRPTCVTRTAGSASRQALFGTRNRARHRHRGATSFRRGRSRPRLHAHRRATPRRAGWAYRWLSLVHVRSTHPFVHEWGSEVLGTDVAAMLEPRGCVLALQPPGFDPPELTPRGALRMSARCLHPGSPGPLDPATAALLTEPGDPWVLLSLSTTQQGQPDALPGLLAALASPADPRAADTGRRARPRHRSRHRTT